MEKKLRHCWSAYFPYNEAKVPTDGFIKAFEYAKAHNLQVVMQTPTRYTELNILNTGDKPTYINVCFPGISQIN